MTTPISPLDVGVRVRTNYGTGPYIIREIVWGCRCCGWKSGVSPRDLPPRRPHVHLAVTDARTQRERLYLHAYDPYTLRCVDRSDDHLIIVDDVDDAPAVQRSLFAVAGWAGGA